MGAKHHSQVDEATADFLQTRLAHIDGLKIIIQCFENDFWRTRFYIQAAPEPIWRRARPI